MQANLVNGALYDGALVIIGSRLRKLKDSGSIKDCAMGIGCSQEGEDGETETVFVVEDIAAGSDLAGLAMQCVDAAGRPVAEGTPGKVRATWIQGTKKLRFGPDGTFTLLNIRVRPR